MTSAKQRVVSLLALLAFFLRVELAQAQSWQVKDGSAKDIAVGADGSVWVIGTDSAPNGSSIYRRRGSAWVQVPGRAERIGVDAQGNAWVVNGSQGLLRYNGTGWTASARQARDVAVGADGTVWIIGNEVEVDGYSIYRSNDKGTTWTKVPGSALRIAVDKSGYGWIVNNKNKVLRYDGRNWTQVGNGANEVAAGPDGAVWMTGTDDAVYKWENGQWVRKAGSGRHVAAGPNGTTWLVNAKGQIMEMAGTIIIEGTTTSIPVSPDPGTATGATRGNTDVTSGSLIVNPNPTSSGKEPLVVKGLAPVFDPSGVVPGSYLCPLLRDGRLAAGCLTMAPKAWERKTRGPATYRGKSNGLSCDAYKRAAGLGYAFHDPREGGECWSCPVLMHRSIHPVTNTDPLFAACTVGNDEGIVWRSAQFPEPGLSRFILHPDILLVAFTNPMAVDAFLEKRVGVTRMTKAQLWDRMANAPNDSPELKALIFGAILATARNPAKATANASAVVELFQDYIKKRRTYLATEASAMYEKYLDYNSYKQVSGAKAVAAAGGPMAFISAASGALIQSPSAGLGGLMGVAPDDYVNAAYAAAVPDARGLEFISALGDLSKVSAKVDTVAGTGQSVDIVGLAKLGLNVSSSFQGIHDALSELRVINGLNALSGKAGINIGLGSSLGGAVLDAVGAVLTLIAQEEAAAKYATLVADAAKPVSIESIMDSGSDDERRALILWWALATSGYQAGPDFPGTPLGSATLCSKDTLSCGWIKHWVSAARPKVVSQTTPTNVNPDGTDVNAYKPENGPLSLLNCAGNSVTVKTFNSTDGALLVPYGTYTLAFKDIVVPKCATSSCKLEVNGVRTGALSGYQVAVGGALRATNSSSFQRGCAAYIPTSK